MAADLSICLCIRDSELNYLEHLVNDCFKKFFPQAEYLLCCNCESRPIKNFITGIKGLTVKIFYTHLPDDRLDYMYKTGADHASCAYTLFIPHQRLHMFSGFPKPIRIRMVEKEEFISVFTGKNFSQSSLLLCKNSIFKKHSFSLSPSFLTEFLSINCVRISTRVEWHDYFCEKGNYKNDFAIQLPGDIPKNLATPENSGRKEIQEIVEYKLNGVPKMKNVLVVTTDPYPLELEYCPKNYIEKAKKTTAPGLRTWSMINWLYNQGVNVTLGCIQPVYVIPIKPYKFPIINIEKDDINRYSSAICQTGHSAVDRVMSKFRGNLILDCWVPSMVEYPLSLMRRNLKIENFTATWRNVGSQLYKIANYFLYPHKRTLGLVLGSTLFSQKITINDMLDTRRFIHVPYCAPVSTSFTYPTKTRKMFLDNHPTCRHKKVMCWFGGNYPWFDFEKVLFYYQELCKTRDDIVLVLKSFNNYKSLTEGLRDRSIPNLIVDNEWLYQEEKINYLTDIDFFFILGGVGFEGIFANRTRTLDLCSLGCHVITNEDDVVGRIAAKHNLATLVNKNNTEETLRTLNHLLDNKDQIHPDLRGFREKFACDQYYAKILEVL